VSLSIPGYGEELPGLPRVFLPGDASLLAEGDSFSFPGTPLTLRINERREAWRDIPSRSPGVRIRRPVFRLGYEMHGGKATVRGTVTCNVYDGRQVAYLAEELN